MKTATPASVFANAPEALGGGNEAGLPPPLERAVRAIYRRSPLYGRRFPLPP